MITAYVEGISSLLEGEDIEISFIVLDEKEETIMKERFFSRYLKPSVVDHMALIALLRKLKRYKDSDIVIYINNPSLLEQIRGISNTKNKEALKLAKDINSHLKDFTANVKIQDVSINHKELHNWAEKLSI